MANNAVLRKRLEEHQSKVDEEQAWWDRKRANIQESFMKQLDEESAASNAAEARGSGSAPKAATVGSRSAASSVAGDRVGSDEDAVLVEAGGPAAAGGSKAGKKKKGKSGK